MCAKFEVKIWLGSDFRQKYYTEVYTEVYRYRYIQVFPLPTPACVTN